MYHNPYALGYEVLSKSGYFVGSQSASAPSYHFTNDFPDYAVMFYSPTNHEVMTSIRYGNFEPGYDNLSEIRESLIAPMEFYMPSASFAFDGVGKQNNSKLVPSMVKDKLMAKVNKEIFDEIKKAQKQAGSKLHEQESPRRIRKIEVEDILLLRRIRKTIIFEEKEEVI